MEMKLNINTNVEITELSDLVKLRKVLEANGLEKPNYSKLSRELGVDRRTIKKHYEKNGKVIERKKRESRVDVYEERFYNIYGGIEKNI